MSSAADRAQLPSSSFETSQQMDQCSWITKHGEPRSTHLADFGGMILVGSIARDLGEHGYAKPISDIREIVTEYGHAAVEHAALYGHAGV